MTTLWVTLIGSYGVWFAYNMSITRGKRRRTKRGLLDYGNRKLRREMREQYRGLAEEFWGRKRVELGMG